MNKYRYKRFYKIPKCPVCGGDTLIIESDGAEMMPENWVECKKDDCVFTSEVTKEFEPLDSWYGWVGLNIFRNSKSHRRRRMLVGGRR